MYNTRLILNEVTCELMDLQVFLQSQYPSYKVEGLSVLPLTEGNVELIIHSDVNIPEDLIDEISQEISSFIPSEKEPETIPLSVEELTDLVSIIFAKLVERNTMDDTIAAEYANVLQNGMKLSRSIQAK